jgi:hypothetical protein
MAGRRALIRAIAMVGVLTAGVVAVLTMQPGSARAGGWAVSSLDPLPESMVSGRDLSVGVTILQHGVSPVQLDNVVFVIDGSNGTERFTAKPEGAIGHYVAVVRFPSAGEYRWTLEPGWFQPQSLGTVTVGDPDAAVSLQQAASDRRGSLPARTGTALATTLAAACTAVFALRSRKTMKSQRSPHAQDAQAQDSGALGIA